MPPSSAPRRQARSFSTESFPLFGNAGFEKFHTNGGIRAAPVGVDEGIRPLAVQLDATPQLLIDLGKERVRRQHDVARQGRDLFDAAAEFLEPLAVLEAWRRPR